VSAQVLDASVFVAARSPQEVHHQAAVALLAAFPMGTRFLVPAVFRVEVMAAMARRGESDEYLSALDAQIRGPAFSVVPVGPGLLDAATDVARRARVRGYDALYAAVALREQATLLTMDGDLARRLVAAYPAMSVQPQPA
jgi:predicted nucleic acid-binding protein